MNVKIFSVVKGLRSLDFVNTWFKIKKVFLILHLVWSLFVGGCENVLNLPVNTRLWTYCCCALSWSWSRRLWGWWWWLRICFSSDVNIVNLGHSGRWWDRVGILENISVKNILDFIDTKIFHLCCCGHDGSDAWRWWLSVLGVSEEVPDMSKVFSGTVRPCCWLLVWVFGDGWALFDLLLAWFVVLLLLVFPIVLPINLPHHTQLINRYSTTTTHQSMFLQWLTLNILKYKWNVSMVQANADLNFLTALASKLWIYSILNCFSPHQWSLPWHCWEHHQGCQDWSAQGTPC